MGNNRLNLLLGTLLLSVLVTLPAEICSLVSAEGKLGEYSAPDPGTLSLLRRARGRRGSELWRYYEGMRQRARQGDPIAGAIYNFRYEDSTE